MPHGDGGQRYCKIVHLLRSSDDPVQFILLAIALQIHWGIQIIDLINIVNIDSLCTLHFVPTRIAYHERRRFIESPLRRVAKPIDALNPCSCAP